MVQTRKQDPSNSKSVEMKKVVKVIDTNDGSKVVHKRPKVDKADFLPADQLKEAQKVKSIVMTAKKENTLMSSVVPVKLPHTPVVRSELIGDNTSLNTENIGNSFDDFPVNEFVYQGSSISIRTNTHERSYKKWIKIIKESQVISVQEEQSSADSDSFFLSAADIQAIRVTDQLTNIPLQLTNEEKLTFEFATTRERTLFLIELSSLINSRRKRSITPNGSLTEKSSFLLNYLSEMDSVGFIETTIKILKFANQQKEKPLLVRATIHPFDNVLKLKTMFQTKKGFPIADQTLLLDRRIILENDKIFHFYRISKISELLLLV
jgi:hypothetical protein